MTTLNCKGRILEAIVTDPKFIRLPTVSSTAPPQTVRVSLKRGDGGPIAPSITPLSQPGFESEIREVKPGEEYELVVTMIPAEVRKQISAMMVIKTGVEESPEHKITLRGRLIPPVTAQPRSVMVPANADSNWSETIVLKWDDKTTPHKILSANIDLPGVKVDVHDDHGESEVMVRAVDGFSPKPGAYYLTIKTDDKKSPDVRVPVRLARASPPLRRSAPGAAKGTSGLKTNRNVKTKRKPVPVRVKPKVPK